MKEANFLGIGWGFPPTFELASRQLSMTAKSDNIAQSINLILLTACGERSLMPEFGSRLNNCLFNHFDGSLAAQMKDWVSLSLLQFEPRIKVEQVEIKDLYDEHHVQQLEIQVSYIVKMTNTRHNHVLPYSLTEATNLVVKQG
jgi:phage baseplate assembly protein W